MPVVQRFTTRVIQRDITVQNVDFNPVAAEGEQFRHGFVTHADFNATLRDKIRGSGAFAETVKNRAQNVIAAVSPEDQNFNAADIPTLAQTITANVVAEYGRLGFPIAGPRLDTLGTLVQEALAENIAEDWAINMDEGERNAFDALATAANVVLSRQKGVASTIPWASVGGVLRGRVSGVLDIIRAERLRWGAATLTLPFLLDGYKDFARSILARQRENHYQGNHTNNAGWLPAVPTPTDRVTAAHKAFWYEAPSRLEDRLRSPNPVAALADIVTPGGVRTNTLRIEYTRLLAAHIDPLRHDAIVKLSAMAALCQGVSAYIEYSMTGSISRLLYEPVNSRVYMSAHYKWRNGYNPFFQITGFPAV